MTGIRRNSTPVGLLACRATVLRDPDDEVRIWAVHAVATLDKAAALHPNLLPRPADLLQDGHKYVCRAAAEAVRKLGENGHRLFVVGNNRWPMRLRRIWVVKTVEELSRLPPGRD